MAVKSRYDWNATPSSAQSLIRPWMVIALVLSASVHAGLYFWFQKVVVPREQSPTRSAIENLKDLKVQQVINEKIQGDEVVVLLTGGNVDFDIFRMACDGNLENFD